MRTGEVAALTHVISTLDGFREPPFPFSKLYKAAGKHHRILVPRQVELDESFLNYCLVTMGEKDAKVRELWTTLRKEIEKLQPFHEEYDRSQKRLLFEFAAGIIVIIFVLKFVGDTLSLPTWFDAAVFLGLVYLLSRSYGASEQKYRRELLPRWKAGSQVKALIDHLGNSLTAAAKREGVDPQGIRLHMRFDDYRSYRVVSKRDHGYVLSPMSRSATTASKNSHDTTG